VKTVTLLQVDGHRVVFEALLRSTEEDFLNLIKNDAQLIKVNVVEPVQKPAVNEVAVNEAAELSPDTKNSVPEGALPEVSNETEAVAAKPALAPGVPLYHFKLLN